MHVPVLTISPSAIWRPLPTAQLTSQVRDVSGCPIAARPNPSLTNVPLSDSASRVPGRSSPRQSTTRPRRRAPRRRRCRGTSRSSRSRRTSPGRPCRRSRASASGTRCARRPPPRCRARCAAANPRPRRKASSHSTLRKLMKSSRGKDGRAREDGVEVDPPRRRAGQAFRAPDLLARRSDLPAGGRPSEPIVEPQDDLDDRGPVARHQPLRDHGRPALLAPGRDQLHDLVELVGRERGLALARNRLARRRRSVDRASAIGDHRRVVRDAHRSGPVGSARDPETVARASRRTRRFPRARPAS